MANSVTDFFTYGVIPTVKKLSRTKAFKASLGGFGSFLIPHGESLAIFRVAAHESAHGLEGMLQGVKVVGIEIEYSASQISGTTELDNTTEQSALPISLAGLGCDIGFVACSTIALKKISPTYGVIFLCYDLISFFMSNDYKVYKIAKERMQREKI